MRRAAAVLIATLIASTVGAVGPMLAGAADVQVVRVSGEERYATSAAISRSAFPTQVPTVYLAAGRRFPDALAGAPAARKANGPLLLSQRSTMPPAIADEMTRLQPSRVVILGGKEALADSVETQVKSVTKAEVTRLAGADRFETAAIISATVFQPEVAVAFVVSGLDFPDAIVAGAGGAGQGGPVLLATPDAVPPATEAELSRLQPRSIIVVGGPVAIGAAVVQHLEAFGPVRRIAGDDRYATAAALSSHLFPNGAERAYVASGDSFPDALSGAPVAGFLPAPLLLVPSGTASAPPTLPETVRAEVARVHPSQLVVYGGEAVVPPSMATALQNAASGSTPPSSTTTTSRSVTTSSTTAPSTGTPNLLVDAVSSPPATLTAGAQFSATDSVVNSGTGTAGTSAVGFFFSPDGVTLGTRLTGGRALGSLVPGAKSAGTSTVEVPATMPAGTYRMLGCADADSTVTEATENDNCRLAAGSVIVSANSGGGGGGGTPGGSINLLVTQVSTPPASAPAGGSFSMTDEVANQGNGPAPHSLTAFYLSTDSVRGPDDVRLGGNRNVPNLSAGASSAGTSMVTVPNGLTPGSYVLIACADDLAEVSESSETDNCRTGSSITITAS